MSDRIKEIKKALKLLAMVNRPTGNPHHDELARNTFKRYCAAHNIDEKTVESLNRVEHKHPGNNRYEAELFLMLAIKTAEEKKMLNDIDIRLDEFPGFVYRGPGFFYDEIYPTYCKLLRKYQITRDEVKAKVDRTSDIRNSNVFQIVGMNGSIFTIMGNMVAPSVKYSEQAFYNAFIHKYDLMSKCILDKFAAEQAGKPPQEPTKEQQDMNKSIQEMYGMFHKESMNDQLDNKS